MTIKDETMSVAPVWLAFGLSSAQWYGLAALSNRLQEKGVRTTGILPIASKQGIELLLEGSSGKAFSLSLSPKGELLLTCFASLDQARCQGLYKGYNLEEMGRRIVWQNAV
jgi:hypothetical protein